MSRPTEDELIARLLAPLAGEGAFSLRDDAAVATPPAGCDLVVTKDMLVAGVHFFADDPPGAIAAKSLRVNLSDLAAKGAVPSGFLLGLGLPRDWTEPWLVAFVDGLAEDAKAFGCPLLGGDTIATPGPLTLSITAFGHVPTGRMVPRPGARAGDRLYVTGTVGDAVLGLHLRWNRPDDRAWTAELAPDHRASLIDRHLRPQPRLALRDALRRHARCAMDVSDGFAGDLVKMLALGELGAVIELAAVPVSEAVAAACARAPRLLALALTGGDDYEIVCAVPPGEGPGFEAEAAAAGVRVTPLGLVAERADVMIVDAAGRPIADGATGRFQHF